MVYASLVAQTVKRLTAMQETRVQFLDREDPLEKEMAIHSSTLAWKIPWMEEPDRLQSMGSQRVRQLSDFTFTFPEVRGLKQVWEIMKWILELQENVSVSKRLCQS